MSTIDRVFFTDARYKSYFSFWRRYFSECGKFVNFRQKQNRDRRENNLIRSYHFQLSEQSSKYIFEFLGANDKDISVFVLLLSSFSVLISKYSGSNNIVIDTPPYGVSPDNIDYAGNIPVLISVEPDMLFKEHLNNVKSTLKDVYRFQNFPLALIDSPEKESNANILFLYEGLHAAISNTEGYDLIVSVKRAEQQIDIDLQFLNHAFDHEFISNIEPHFNQTLSYLKEPYTAVGSLSILSAAGYEHLFSVSSGLPVLYPKKSLIDIFDERAVEYGDRIAVVYGAVSLTYGELDACSNRLAHCLLNGYDVRAGSLVGLMVERSEQLLIGLLGILKAGCGYVALDPRYPADRLRYMIRDAGLDLVVSDVGKGVSGSHKVVSFTESAGYSASSPGLVVSSGDIAYAMYTSGSTGQPKGVLIEHGSVVNLSYWHHLSFGVTEQSRGSVYASIGFDAMVWEIWPYLLSGSSVHIIGEEQRLALGDLHLYLRTAGITHSFLPTGVWESFPSKETLGKEMVILTGGDQLKSISDRPVVNNYGPTEATVVSTSIGLSMWQGTAIPIGRPIFNTEVYLLDAHQQMVPVGVEGELYIGGAGLSRGYLNRPELTEERFIAHPFKAGARLYRTGDGGRWQWDGNIEFLGRTDDQVKIRGQRVELGEIESLVQESGLSQQSVVQVHEDGDGHKHLVGYVVSAEAIDRDYLIGYLRDRLPEHMVPLHWIVLEHLPLTVNGKLDKKSLPQPILDFSPGYAGPRNELEWGLVEIWERVLSRKQIGIRDNFFELGGHSLKAMQVVLQVHKQLHRRLELKDVFSHPTIQGLSELVLSESGEGAGLISRVGEQPSYALSHSQQRLWIEYQLHPGSIAYNIPGSYRLRGQISVGELGRAFRDLVGRHEILRTLFISEDGEPRQVIQREEESSFCLDYADLRGEPEGWLKVKGLVQTQAETVFDLSGGPLLKASLWQLGESEYVFSLTMHHIISDGWSMQVLINEVLRLYASYSKGDPSPLEPLRIQYKDYVYWQQSQLSGDRLEAHRFYWHERLGLDLPVLDLPLDYPRPVVKTYRGAATSLLLEGCLSRDLGELGRRYGATLFMTLVASLKVLLYRYTGQEDIVVGTPIAGREHSDLEHQIGFYVNMLALRTRFRGEDTFEELLEKVKETMLGAYEHQVYPFDRLVEELPHERDMSRSPLFDVAIASSMDGDTGHHAPSEKEQPGFSYSEYEFDRVVSKFDLQFNIVEHGQQILIDVEYNIDMFTKDKIEKMLKRLERILADAINCSGSKPLKEMQVEIETEKKFFDMWEEVLGYRPSVSTLDQDILQTVAGDTQLEALCKQINENYKIQLTISDIYLYQTINGLMSYVNTLKELNGIPEINTYNN